MPSQNGIVGDADYGMQLPERQYSPEDIQSIANAARFSKTREYRELKEYLDGRIAFYQSHLPDGRPLNSVSKADREDMWVIANAIIGEIRSFTSVYEQAAETMKDLKRVRR